jgi:hypothetical protein
MIAVLRNTNVFWKSKILWILMIFSLALVGCAESGGMELPTATSGPPPTPIPPAVYDLSEKMDGEGVLTEGIELVSTDERVILHLDEGTRIVDKAGQSVQSITITTRPPKAEIEYSVLSSPTYEIDPRGTLLDPPGKLTIHYDAPPDLAGIDPEDAQIGVSCAELGIDWEILDTQSDMDKLVAMTDVDCLGSFIVVFLVRIIS